MPEMPNELTPAILFPRPPPHGTGSVGTRMGRAAQSILGLGTLKCREGGMTPSFKASITLISEATPAVASVWPMLVLTEPIHNGSERSGQ